MNEDLLQIRKFIAPEILFGSGSRFLLNQYCRNYHARKVLVVTDRNVRNLPWMTDIINNLDQENINYAVFDRFTPNPRSEEVQEGAAFFHDQKCDLIAAIGGGSPMDGAKGIGIVATNGGDILDYAGVNMVETPLPPMIFIPSTAGTAADISQFAIINDRINRVKIAIVSKIAMPDVALIDPDISMTMDPYLTACTGMDAFVHAVEAYVSIASSPLTDTHALEAVRTLSSGLPKIMGDLDNKDLRRDIMFGSLQAGLAFSNAILGAVHAMSHSLGGYLDLPHGECNSLLLEHVVKFNFPVCPDKYRNIAENCGFDTQEKSDEDVCRLLVRYIRELKKNLGITNTLKDCGVKKRDIPVLAKKALNDACLITNPRKCSLQDLEAVYEEAY